MSIQLLAPEVASQIAAGEVVERPASVVKELLENALDAGSTQISIDIKASGRQLVEVADNGSGIPLEELAMAVTRHATSKLTSADELFRISTLGFRGEALASISSVSQLTLTSRDHKAEAGGKVRVEGGKIDSVEVIGAPNGTVVRVENLFYNVPVRLKFLKSDATEKRQIDELVTRYALAYPQIRFQLRHEGRLTFQTTGLGNPREILKEIYGLDLARSLLEVIADYDDQSIRGFISPISYTRSNRREIFFFVNGRLVQDTALTSIVIQAYHTMLMVGRFPQAVLFINLPVEMIDVNVHPAKTEIRFRNREQVMSSVQRAVRRALLAYTPVPGLGIDSWRGMGQSGVGGLNNLSVNNLNSPEYSAEMQQSISPGIYYPQPTIINQEHLPNHRIPLLRSIGQIANAYLVAEGPDGLYLIDQHAAHERILFERFLRQKSHGIPSQVLIEPVLVELPLGSANLIAEQLETLSGIGFQVEPFGQNSFLVRSIPAIISGINPAQALRVLVENFEEDETPLKAEIEAKLIARICKRAAVKAGQILSSEEQKALLADLEACHSPRTCPHGRPTMIHLSVDLLERQFGRRGAR